MTDLKLTDKSSANDFTILASELNKKYNIDAFLKDFVAIFRKKKLFIEDSKESFKNPVSFLSQIQDMKIEEKTLKSIIRSYERLRKKYGYDEYLKDGFSLRTKFFKFREEYLFNRIRFVPVLKNTKASSIEIIGMDIFGEFMLSKWIDSVLLRMKGNSFDIKYEDLDGSVKTITTSHREIEFTCDHIEAPLIDRMSGICAFDSFRLHGFYDHNTSNWVLVPIKLIISTTMEELPDEDLNLNMEIDPYKNEDDEGIL